MDSLHKFRILKVKPHMDEPTEIYYTKNTKKSLGPYLMFLRKKKPMRRKKGGGLAAGRAGQIAAKTRFTRRWNKRRKIVLKTQVV